MEILLGSGIVLVGFMWIYGSITGRLAAMLGSLIGQGQQTTGGGSSSNPLSILPSVIGAAVIA